MPEEELQTSAPDGPNSLVDRRALKVLQFSYHIHSNFLDTHGLYNSIICAADLFTFWSG